MSVKILFRESDKKILRKRFLFYEEWGESYKTLTDWLDYAIEQAEGNLGAFAIPTFMKTEIEAMKIAKQEVGELGNRLYITETVMADIMENDVITGYRFWEKLKEFTAIYPEDTCFFQWKGKRNITPLIKKRPSLF